MSSQNRTSSEAAPHASDAPATRVKNETRHDDDRPDLTDNDEVPGDEMHRAVYFSVVAAFGLMFLVAWLAFGYGTEVDFNLAMATVLGIIVLALPWLIHATASHHRTEHRQKLDEFVESEVDTATGWIPASHAWIEILIIPAALGLAAILIGIVHVVLR